MNILVTGGAGHLGRDFVQAATAAGHVIRIASRRPRPADAPDELEWATVGTDSRGDIDAATMNWSRKS